MARGVQIALTLNPRDFIKGLKQIELSTEDVVDALEDMEDVDLDIDTKGAERDLEDVADAAEDAKDELSDIKDGADDAERALSGLGSEAKSELGKVETAAQQAGAEVESELKDGAKDAEKAFSKLGSSAKADMQKVETAVGGVDGELSTLEDESAQSAKEFGASFRGDPVEAVEEVQALISELSNKYLPGAAGAVVGIFTGVAFGAMIGFFERWREEQEARREQIADWRDDIVDAFGALDDVTLAEALTDQLDEAGLSATDFADLLADTADDVQAAWERFVENPSLENLEAFYAQIEEDAARFGDTALNSAGQVVAGYGRQEEAANRLSDALGDTDDRLRAAVGDAQALEDVGLADSLRDSEEAADDTTESLEDLEGALDDAARAIQDFGSAARDEDASADDFQQSIADLKETVRDFDGKPLSDGITNSTQAARDAKDALRDVADSTLDYAAAQIEAGASVEEVEATVQRGRAAIVNQGIALGLTAEEAGAYADELGLIPDDVSSTVTVDDNGTIDGVQSDLDGIEAPTVPVDVEPTPSWQNPDYPFSSNYSPPSPTVAVDVTDNGTSAQTQAQIDGIDGTEPPGEVSDNGTVDATQRAIDGIDGRFVVVAVTDQGTTYDIQREINDLRGRTVYIDVVKRTVENP